jgi:two-component system cell cycle sensor histidine kinase/response regulator CckA
MTEGRSLRILQVEDSADDAELILRQLRQGGVEIQALRVETAEAMREALETGEWDIIFSDYQVPGFGGLEALHVLEDSGLDIPFILISGAVGEEIAVSVMKAGAHDYVQKGHLARLGPAVERELKEAALRREERAIKQALKESQAGLERAQALARLGSWEWDLRDRNPTWSPELFRLFGLEIAAPAPDYDGFVERVLPEDRPLVLGTIEEVIATGKPMGLEYRIQTLQGEIRHVYEHAEPVLDEWGRATRLRGTIQDITERKRMERVIEDMGRVSAKGRLAAYIAHEINNPLAGIKNAFQLVERALPENHPHAHYAELIKREIDRIASIIRTMYHVYRPPTPEIKDVSLLQAFQDIESLLLPKLRTCGVETVVELRQPEMKVRMNEGLLRQVLFNLVLNAVDASPKGGQIVLGAFRTEDECCITVEDQGSGISPELAERVFEPGFTTKRDAAMSGLGLGLSTCRNIVESMGGSLCFGSGLEGQGTVFRVCLPLPPPE